MPPPRWLRGKSAWVAGLGLLSVWAVWGPLWDSARNGFRARRTSPTLRPSSLLAFHEAYLDPSRGNAIRRARCADCHPSAEGLDPAHWDLLRKRAHLPQDAWADAVQLQAHCGSCHPLPHPANLPWPNWSDVMSRMREVLARRNVAQPPADRWSDIAHFYYTFSSEQPRPLVDEPDPASSPVRFAAAALGRPPQALTNQRPVLGHVAVVQLAPDPPPEVLVCDTEASSISWIRQMDGAWTEEVLAQVPYPGRARTFERAVGGPVQIIVACLGTLVPTDDLVGRVVLLVNNGSMQFQPVTLLEDVSRVADVQAGDFDQDGDVDFVVAAYGYLSEGEVGWLEQTSSGQYLYRPILRKTGAMDVAPADLNGDGRLDFVASFAQEHEEIAAFINKPGGFEAHVLFKATTPAFGLSGLHLVDLDSDGDVDVLFTNGDNMDLPTFVPRPFHGVQWLENLGGLQFACRYLYRLYGAYSATAADLNHDGYRDVVISSMFNDWKDPKRASLIWLENDGRQHFRPHTIARDPIHLIATAAGDLNADGRTDLLACGMNAFAPFERMGRITWWQNLGPASVGPASR